jgi:hypothetical protein
MATQSQPRIARRVAHEHIRQERSSASFFCSGAAGVHNLRSAPIKQQVSPLLLLRPNRLLKNYCATLIRACAVLGILMYSICTLRFLCSGRTRLKAARDVFQQPAN